MRSYGFTILMCFVLGSATLQAQRTGSDSQVGNGNRMGSGNGLFRPHGFGHHRRSGGGALLLPYGYWGDWDDSSWGYGDYSPDNGAQESSYPAAANESSRPVVVMASQQPAAPPAVSPKLVEIPLSKDGAATRQKAPALFVLTSGERLEGYRYVLTSDSLRVEVGGKQLTIPVTALNVPATIAANQERGIDMMIPQDHSSLFLGF
jgi:hypothetical protein